uniref:Integrase zinc-binding domain-containing protein n=1 Tax=Tanacetum cinerariifolium TaxID=118510 RepID=A0A6L2KIR3_TANCI|nr:hypothetical protein [Tanacetum cinerariifolium]
MLRSIWLYGLVRRVCDKHTPVYSEAYGFMVWSEGSVTCIHPYAQKHMALWSYISFISTESVPLLNVKPSILRPTYVIEVAYSKKIETNRIIHGCILELGDSLFTIDLIPFGHGSFLLLLPSGKVLIVQGERTEESPKSLKSMKLNEHKLDDILIVRDFLNVFPKDLSRLPPHRQVEFYVDLVLRATPISNSQYRLAPSEMQELSKQLQELLALFLKDRSLFWLSPAKEDHEIHLKLVLELLKKEKLYAKFSKCEFWLQEVHFFRHVVDDYGIDVDPRGVRTLIMDESHATRYSIHPRVDKMYHDLRDMYWWPESVRNVIRYKYVISSSDQWAE